jgi:tetratricopeptide (TPR) repeat protein
MTENTQTDTTSLSPSLARPDVDPSVGFLESASVRMIQAGSEDFELAPNEIGRLEMGKAFYQLGKLHYDKADLNEAEGYFVKSLECTERPRDTFSIFKILGFLIRIASEKLEDEKAQYYIAQSEKLVDDLAQILGSLNAEYFYNVGIIKNYSGNFEEARQNFELCYKRSKEENEPDLLAKCLLALAINCYNKRDFDGALDYLGQLGQLLKIIKKSYLSGAMYLFSAKIYLELDMFDNALKYFKYANQTLQNKKCWNLYGYILLGKGTVFKRSGDFEKAALYYQLARESVEPTTFKRLSHLIEMEIEDVNDSSVDIYLDRTNRLIKERDLGVIDFKHRFVLLEILFLLAKNSGTYFDKEQLARMVWKDEYNPLIHDKLIYTSVSRLRKLIEPKTHDKSERRKYIIRGKDGYTFNPSVKIRFHMESKSKPDKTIGNVELSSPV